jgi:hypothetical protein
LQFVACAHWVRSSTRKQSDRGNGPSGRSRRVQMPQGSFAPSGLNSVPGPSAHTSHRSNRKRSY